MAKSPFSSLSPDDAEVAVRSFARRFRDAASAATVTLDDEVDQAELDEIANRPGGDGRSGLDHIASAAARMDAAGTALHSALVSSTEPIGDHLLSDEPTWTPDHSGQLDVELDGLERAATALAEVIDRADASRWLVSRPSTGNGSGTANPLDLVRATIGVALGHLRSLERVLREVRGRPSS